MRSITITYTYDGDETLWRTAIDSFITSIDTDPDVAGKFTYQVATADDGKTRIHWARWDTPETHAYIHTQDYFKTFAGKVREFGGDTLQATQADIVIKTTD